MAQEWRRNNAPLTTKGVEYATPHVEVIINNFDPCDILYLPKPVSWHNYDSHGSSDHLFTSFVSGTLVRWASNVECAGSNGIKVIYESWLLIAGSTGQRSDSCGEHIGLVPCINEGEENEECEEFEWLRNNAPLALIDGVLTSTKGYWEHIIILPMCQKGDPCEQIMQPGEPICGNIVTTPPQAPVDSRALAARRYYDSHGQLDRIEGYNFPGPSAFLLRDARIETLPCPPPNVGIRGRWQLVKTRQRIDLHPGSVFLGRDEEVYTLCCDCSCVCDLSCELRVFPEFCCLENINGVCAVIHVHVGVRYLNELVGMIPGCETPIPGSSDDIVMTWDDANQWWFGTFNGGCIGDGITIRIYCVGTDIFELFIQGTFGSFTCTVTNVFCCPFVLNFLNCNLGIQAFCCGTVLVDVIATE